MKIKHVYQFIGIIGFFVILSRVDISDVARVIRSVSWKMLFFIALSSLVISVLKAARWKELLKLFDVDCKFKNVLIAYFMGTFLGVITPAKVGDVSRVYYIKKISAPDVSSGRLFSNIMADRIFDLAVVGIIAVIGNAYYFSRYFVPLLFFCGAFVILVIFLYRSRYRIISPIRKVLEKIERSFPKISLQFHFDEIIEGLRVLRTWRIINAVLFNLLAFCAFYATIALIAYVLDIKIPLFYLMAAMSSAMLFSVLPITIAGVGVRDAVLIFFFLRIGISNEVTISFSFFYLLFCLVLPGMIGSFPYLFHPGGLKKALEKVENNADLT